jgi:hypothetical protein
MMVIFWNVWNVPRSWNVGHTTGGIVAWGRSNLGVLETWNIWNVLIVFGMFGMFLWYIGNVLIVFNKTKKIPERAVQVHMRLSRTVL